ncbi:MAG: NAD-binding protein [Gracilimonas sp.]|nr:NAD-binding protein [Gracilimonas sp.]
MKIVIIGAGEIGYDLASVLSSEKHDVTVLDRDKDALMRVADSLDVLQIEGNATSVKDLVSASAGEADILICVTSIDEVNMIAGMIGRRLGAKMVIARIRSDEFSDDNAPLTPSDLGIDVMIHPELSAAHEIAQLLKRSSASDIINLADERMQIIGIRLEKDSPLINTTINEFADTYPELIFRVVAIGRRGRTIIPSGSVKFQNYDQVFILAETKTINDVIKTTGKKEKELHSVMIAGGSGMGAMIAKLLVDDPKKNWSVKLIEPDYDKAEQLAIDMKEIMVLHGNPN